MDRLAAGEGDRSGLLLELLSDDEEEDEEADECEDEEADGCEDEEGEGGEGLASPLGDGDGDGEGDLRLFDIVQRHYLAPESGV